MDLMVGGNGLRPDEVPRPAVTFNSPLEAGVRAVTLLVAAFPNSFDLTRLVVLDHLLVHTGDVDGPESLHPPVPLRAGELLVRRPLIERGLLLMMTRDLVEREPTADGIGYLAGEGAAPFLDAIESIYLRSLRDRARWLVENLAALSDDELRARVRGAFDPWTEEFHAGEQSAGAAP